MKRLMTAALVAVAACEDAPPARQAAAPAPTVAQPTASNCPANGAWAECSVLYRLERAGVAPAVDTTGKPDEGRLGGTTMLLKIGLSAHLEVHLYADSASRAAATAKLDRTQFVSGTHEQTIKRERTLIESANLVAFFTSINSHQRERVSDALTAGPPQPTGAAQPLPPAKSTPPTTTK